MCPSPTTYITVPWRLFRHMRRSPSVSDQRSLIHQEGSSLLLPAPVATTRPNWTVWQQSDGALRCADVALQKLTSHYLQRNMMRLSQASRVDTLTCSYSCVLTTFPYRHTLAGSVKCSTQHARQSPITSLPAPHIPFTVQSTSVPWATPDANSPLS